MRVGGNLAIKVPGEEFSPATNFSPDKEQTLTERFQAAIFHLPTKTLARAAGCSTDTAKSWKAGKAVPYAPHLFRLARQLDVVREWVRFESDPGAGLGYRIATLQQQALMPGQEGAIARAQLNKIMEAASA